MTTSMCSFAVVTVIIGSSTSLGRPSNNSENNEDGDTFYYPHTMNETIFHILRTSNVQPNSDVVEVILNAMSKNLQAVTVSKILKSLDGELDEAHRSNYVDVAIPKIVGLYKKMNVFIYKLAKIYGFSGESIKFYAKLLRPMQLSSIVSAALDGAQNENNSEQYKQILALAREIGNMDGYQNKTMTKQKIIT